MSSHRAAELSAKRHLHFDRTLPGDSITRRNRPVAFDYHEQRITVFNTDCDTIEVTGMLTEYVVFRTFFDYGLAGKHDLVFPSAKWHSQLRTLTNHPQPVYEASVATATVP